MALRLSTITLFVFAVHAALILWMVLFVPATPILLKVKPRVVVHTISLNPKQTAAARIEPEPVYVMPIEESAPPSVEKMPRLEENKVTVSETKVTVMPIPKLEKPVKKAAEPKIEEKKSKKVTKTETAKPKMQQVKPKTETAKPKKETTKPKTETAKPKKQQVKPKTEKTKPQKEQAKPKETSAADEKKKVLQKKNQELLAKAQESIAKIRPPGVKIDANPKGKAADLLVPKLTFATVAAEETTSQSASWSMGELSYRDELAGRLKLQLVLPEYGSVKLKLTLKRSGSVAKVAILSAASRQNRAYVEKMMPTLQFPPFGNHFSQEQEHTFTITLNNDF